jgi:hypothetical protein
MHATSLWLHFIAFGSLRHAGLCAVHVIAGRREIHTSGWLWLVHAGIEHAV